MQNFTRFFMQGGYSGENLRIAYDTLMGVTDKPIDIAAKPLLAEMQRLVEEERFPVNRFVELIRAKEKLENALPRFDLFVDSLPITPGEKRMLKSIVAKRRSGTLEFRIAGEMHDEIILKGSQHLPVEQFAVFFQDYLEGCIGKVSSGEKYEFTFIE